MKHHFFSPSRLSGLGLVAALCSPSAVLAELAGEPSATPSRPTVTSGAAISAPGWLEVEFGLQRTRDKADDDQSRRDSIQYLLKYAINQNWAIWMGGDAAIRNRNNDGVVRGAGDTTLTLKHKFDLAAAGHSAGFELAAKIPTADEKKQLGSGEPDYGLRAIYGLELLADFQVDSNLALTRNGLKEAGVGRNSYHWGVVVSRPLSDRLSFAVDLYGVRQSGAPSTRQLQVAAIYAINRRVVADAGMQRGLNEATSNWTAFAGVTVLLGKL